MKRKNFKSKTNLKIGILWERIVPGASPVIGGEETRNLLEQGIHAELLLGMGNLPKSLKNNSFIKGLPLRICSKKMPRWITSYFSKPFPLFSFFSPSHLISPLYFHRSIKPNDFDIIVAHGIPSATLAYKLWKKHKIPYLAFVWDPYFYSLNKIYATTPVKRLFPIAIPIAKYVDKKMVRNATAISVCSKFHHEYISSISDKHVSIIYPGCFPAKSIPKKRGNYLLAIDRWDMGNVPDFLLDILEKVDDGLKLLIAGYWYPESMKRDFLKKAKEKGLEKRIIIKGSANKKQLADLYSNARALIHPIEEAFGMTGLEAAAYGCPMVFPKGSGVTDLFIHGKHGFFPKQGDLIGMIKFTKVFEDERKAYKMGVDAWKVAKNYTWKYHTDCLLKLIKEQAT